MLSAYKAMSSRCMQHYQLTLEPKQIHDKKIETDLQKQQIFPEIKIWFEGSLYASEKQKFYFKEINTISKWSSIMMERHVARKKLATDSKGRLSYSTNNKDAFENFVKNNVHNPQFSGKYVVFVDGCLQGVSDTEIDLVKKIYKKFGNIEMYVGCVSQNMQIELIESPELY